MATPFIDYRPAQVMRNKEVYVCYYVLDPTSNRLKRMRIRCNRIKDRRARSRYASLLCAEVNRKLCNGWNPLTGEESTPMKRASIAQDYHCHFFRIFATSKTAADEPPPTILSNESPHGDLARIRERPRLQICIP